jgi:hypothetical protein
MHSRPPQKLFATVRKSDTILLLGVASTKALQEMCVGKMLCVFFMHCAMALK